jgi:hypothetical protein
MGAPSLSETRGQIDLAALVPAYEDTLRLFDTKYEGIIAGLMRSRPTPRNQLSFRWPLIPDTGTMAPVSDETTSAVYMETAAYMENFATRIYKTGWKLEPTQYDSEIMHGKMGTSLEFKIDQGSKALQRRIEYEGLKYIFGDTSIISRYSSQESQGRLKKWDITDTADGLTGNSWGTITGTTNLPDILFDIDTILYNSKLIGDKDMSKMIVAPKTFYSMQRNIKIKEDIKYVFDVRGNIISGNLRGLNVSEVVYSRYKETSGWSGIAGAPGLGSLMWDKWTDMKSQHMMRHVDASTTYEFFLITADTVGTMWTAPVFTSPSPYPKGSDVTHSWMEHDPLMLKSWRAIRRGFSVDDFADIHVGEKVVEA